jgi:SAM-dependent methyltransferase
MWPNENLNRCYHVEQVEEIERALPDVRGRRLLDVGCGFGRMSRYFASRGALVTGFDFSASAIRTARQTPIESCDSSASTQSASAKDAAGVGRPNVVTTTPTYEVRSVFELDYGPVFDVAFTWGVLTIACKERDDLRRAFASVVGSVKPGGTLLFLEPIHRGPLHRVLSLGLGDFLTDLRDAGATVKSVRGMHFWPTRVLLGYLPFPRWITDPLAGAGRRLTASPFWGDYKLVFAERKTAR